MAVIYRISNYLRAIFFNAVLNVPANPNEGLYLCFLICKKVSNLHEFIFTANKAENKKPHIRYYQNKEKVFVCKNAQY